MTFPDRVMVRARVAKIGNTSFTMEYEIESARLGIAASGEGVVVLLDSASGQKVPVDAALRARIEQLEKASRAP